MNARADTASVQAKDTGPLIAPRPLVGTDYVDPAIAAGWARNEAQRHEAWVERLKHQKCGEAAQMARHRDGALLLWIDDNGELRARRIDPDDSLLREFVPLHLRRHPPA